MIVHFSTNTFLDREWGDGTASPSTFNPTQFDPDQWMRAVRDAGAKYVVLVAKHHDGFCLWPTDQTDYSVKASPWKNGKGDVVGDVVRAARKYGLRFGVYLSPWDRHEPKYSDPREYDKYYLAELTELAQRYGDLVEFWLDGAGSAGHVYDFKKYVEVLRTYQPNTIVFCRHFAVRVWRCAVGGNGRRPDPVRKLECDRSSRVLAMAPCGGGYAAP